MKRKFKYLSLKEVEGVGSTHDNYLNRALEERVKSLEWVIDVHELSTYLGAKLLLPPPIKCSWALEKEIFPQVIITFLYSAPDEEFTPQMRVLFSGENLKEVKGEDLAVMTIAIVNHMLRYVRRIYAGQNLPRVCQQV